MGFIATSTLKGAHLFDVTLGMFHFKSTMRWLTMLLVLWLTKNPNHIQNEWKYLHTWITTCSAWNFRSGFWLIVYGRKLIITRQHVELKCLPLFHFMLQTLQFLLVPLILGAMQHFFRVVSASSVLVSSLFRIILLSAILVGACVIVRLQLIFSYSSRLITIETLLRIPNMYIISLKWYTNNYIRY